MKPSWTDDRILRMKKCLDDGMSAAEIAAELGGVTRNAVIGKAHRLGLFGFSGRKGAKPATTRTTRANYSQRPKGQKIERIRAARNRSDAPKTTSLPLEKNQIPTASITTLKDHTCRWPIGDPLHESFGYCGMEGADNPKQPYCPAHAHLAVAETTPRQRATKIESAKRSIPRTVNANF